MRVGAERPVEGLKNSGEGLLCPGKDYFSVETLLGAEYIL